MPPLVPIRHPVIQQAAVWLVVSVASLLGATAAHAERLAVLEFEGSGLDDEGRAYLTRRVRGEALRHLSFGWKVMTRDNMLVLIDAAQGQCVREGECDVETGRYIGADLIVTGEVVRLGSKLRLMMNSYDTSSGSLLRTAETAAVDVDGLVDGLPDACRRLLELPPRAVEAEQAEPEAGPRDGAEPAVAPGKPVEATAEAEGVAAGDPAGVGHATEAVRGPWPGLLSATWIGLAAVTVVAGAAAYSFDLDADAEIDKATTCARDLRAGTRPCSQSTYATHVSNADEADQNAKISGQVAVTTAILAVGFATARYAFFREEATEETAAALMLQAVQGGVAVAGGF